MARMPSALAAPATVTPEFASASVNPWMAALTLQMASFSARERQVNEHREGLENHTFSNSGCPDAPPLPLRMQLGRSAHTV